jgi:hypothetical protein
MLCTGKRPFVGADMKAVLYMQVHEPPPAPRKVTSKRISEGLERVILRALEKRPQDRFQTVTEFLAALDETQEGQETLTPTVLRDRSPRRRRWRLMLIAAAACIALGATGALWARAHFQRLRAKAVGAFERWTGPRQTPPEQPETKPAPPPEPTPATHDAATAEPSEPPAPAPEAPKPAEHAQPPPEEPEKPAPPPPAPPAHPRSTARSPVHQQVEALIEKGKVNAAKIVLRDRIAVQKDDAWAHLRLGDLYAEAFHYRRDAFREWESAFTLDAALKGNGSFRKSVCEAVDLTDRARVEEFLRHNFGAAETPALLLGCIRAADEPDRIAGAAKLLETVSGTDRPELGVAALRVLELGKTCAQKKAAVETIGRLRYLRARPTLVKLDRQRLAQQAHPTPAVSCFGTSIADAIEQLK